MAQFRIHPQFIRGFIELSKLEEKDSQSISVLVSKMKIGTTEQQLADSIAESSPMQNFQAIAISNTIFSLGALKLSRPDIGKELPKEMALSFKESNGKVTDDELKLLETNLSIILSQDENLILTQKVNTLLFEYEKVFVDTRIISDIRLVYGDEINEAAKHALVVHQLRITYHDSGVSKNIVIALDGGDLDKLKKAVSRAEEKEKQIREGSYTKDVEIIDYS